MDVASVGAAAIRDVDTDGPRRRQHRLLAGQVVAVGRNLNLSACMASHRDNHSCTRMCVAPQKERQQTLMESGARDYEDRLLFIHSMWRRHD